MAVPEFREAQWAQRFDPHIAPINRLVDSLREAGRGWVPYVAPMYGGVHARLISVLRDPGPRTQDASGSGFLSMENDDPTAEAIAGYFAGVGIEADEIVPWNVYPWYINRAPRVQELEAGVDPLRQLIELLPGLRVVMVHGISAHEGWRRLERRYPDLVSGRAITVITTYHTSRQAFWHRDPGVRRDRQEHLRRAFEHAAGVLGKRA